MGAGANYPKPIAPFMQYALSLQTAIRIECVAAGAEARFKQPRLPLKAGVGGLKPLPSPGCGSKQSNAPQRLFGKGLRVSEISNGFFFLWRFQQHEHDAGNA